MIKLGASKKLILTALIIVSLLSFLLSGLVLVFNLKNKLNVNASEEYDYPLIKDSETGSSIHHSLYTEEDFAKFMKSEFDESSYAGSKYYLVCDIDMSNYDAFYPRGTNSYGKDSYYGYSEFCGVLDGEGCTVKNLKIKFDFTGHSNSYNGHNYIGIFAGLGKKSLVRNIRFQNLTIEIGYNQTDFSYEDGEANTTAFIGGLTATAYNTRVENCIIEGLTITATDKSMNITAFGGLIGGAKGGADGWEPSNVQNCYVSVDSCNLSTTGADENSTYYGLVGPYASDNTAEYAMYVKDSISRANFTHNPVFQYSGIEPEDQMIQYYDCYSNKTGALSLNTDSGYWYIPPTDEFNDGWPYPKYDGDMGKFLDFAEYIFYLDSSKSSRTIIEIPYFIYTYYDLTSEAVGLPEYNNTAIIKVYGTLLEPTEGDRTFSYWSGSITEDKWSDGTFWKCSAMYEPVFTKEKTYNVTCLPVIEGDLFNENFEVVTESIVLSNIPKDSYMLVDYYDYDGVLRVGVEIKDKDGNYINYIEYGFNYDIFEVSHYLFNGTQEEATANKIKYYIEEDVEFQPVVKDNSYSITFKLCENLYSGAITVYIYDITNDEYINDYIYGDYTINNISKNAKIELEIMEAEFEGKKYYDYMYTIKTSTKEYYLDYVVEKKYVKECELFNNTCEDYDPDCGQCRGHIMEFIEIDDNYYEYTITQDGTIQLVINLKQYDMKYE